MRISKPQAKTGVFLSGLTRNVILLGVVSMLTDLSSQMIFPLIPLYLVSVLFASASIVGLIEGAADATSSLLKVVSGYYSDKIRKRRPFIFVGYFLSTITKPLFAIVVAWPALLIVRVIERFGKLRDAPRDALIAESTPLDKRGKAFGFNRALDGLGSIIGALLAFLLFPVFGYHKMFLLAFIPALAAVIVIFFVKEKPKKLSPGNNVSFKVSFKKLPWNLKFFIAIAAIFSLGHFGYAFLLLKAKATAVAEPNILLLYVLFNAVYTIGSIPAGIYSDKIGRKPVLLASYLLFMSIAIALIFASAFMSLLALFIFYGIFFAILDTVQRAFVVDLAPKELKGTALGTFHTAIGLTALPAGFIAGLLWDAFTPTATFIFAALLSLTASILFIFVKAGRKNH
jgi:MFS family permease